MRRLDYRTQSLSENGKQIYHHPIGSAIADLADRRKRAPNEAGVSREEEEEEEATTSTDNNNIKRRRFVPPHSVEHQLAQPASFGFRFKQYIDSLSTNFPVVAMMKKWVKGGRQQVWTDATDQQQHSNDLSERNETESSTRRRNNNYNGRIPVIQLSDSPPPTAKNLAHHSLPDADDSDRPSTSRSTAVNYDRRWRHDFPTSLSQNSLASNVQSIRDRRYGDAGVISSVSARVPFNLSATSSSRHTNGGCRISNNLTANVHDFEERERYLQLIEGISAAGSVSQFMNDRNNDTPSSLSTTSVDRIVSEGSEQSRIRLQNHRDTLSRARTILGEIITIDSDSTSEHSSVIRLDGDDYRSVSPIANNSTVSVFNNQYSVDPVEISKEIRNLFIPQSDARKQKVLELQTETNLRAQARRQLEKSINDEVRLRLRLEGLVILDETPVRDDFPELNDEANATIEHAWNDNGNMQEVLCQGFDIEIRRKDLFTLKHLDWLNDEIINFFMQLIVERSKTNTNLPKVYAFNSFFYPKILQSGYAGIKRWTRKVDIFAFDILIVPIHLETIDFRNRRIDYFDSLGGNNTKCIDILRNYLQSESIDKKKQPFNLDNWQFECQKEIPRQENGSDCGMFACKFAEYVSRDAQFNFDQDRMPYFRRRMVYEICTKLLM